MNGTGEDGQTDKDEERFGLHLPGVGDLLGNNNDNCSGEITFGFQYQLNLG